MAWKVIGLGQPWFWRRGAGTPAPSVFPVNVCFGLTRTYYVNFALSTWHSRECGGGSMIADATLRQSFSIAPTVGGVSVLQLWQGTLPAAIVPPGGIGPPWVIKIGFSPTQDSAAVATYTATVVSPGQAGTTDATITFTLNSSDLTGFTFASKWYGSVWRTDTGHRELLASFTLDCLDCVTVP